jgi:hypothetical protein
MSTAEFAPTVLDVKAQRGAGDQIGLTAWVQYPGCEVETTDFFGHTYGTPGVVQVLIPGFTDFIRVDSPERFGDVLNEAWVRAYFA